PARNAVRPLGVSLDRRADVARESGPAEVRLRGRQVLRRPVADRRELGSGAGGLSEQRPDRALGLVVLPLALLALADVPAAVEQVLSRPGVVPVRVPGAVVVFDRDRVADAQLP